MYFDLQHAHHFTIKVKMRYAPNTRTNTVKEKKTKQKKKIQKVHR